MTCKYDDVNKRKYSDPADPAQSAPSAERLLRNKAADFLNHEGILWEEMSSSICGAMERYAALRTAQWENLAKDLSWPADPDFFRTSIEAFRDQIGAYMELETRTAQLERELKDYQGGIDNAMFLNVPEYGFSSALRSRKRTVEFIAETLKFVQGQRETLKTRAETAESALAAQRERTIPDGIDVLITHGPPSGILDQPFGTRPSVGCWDLAQAVERVKPRLHVFGHIHGGYGERQFQGVQYVNASCVDESYKPVNKVRTIKMQTPMKKTLKPAAEI